MPKAKKNSTGVPKKALRPALTPEARENQLIALSMDAAEKQLREGTASSQVIVHFLRLGTEKAKLENEKLKRENSYLEAKSENIQSIGRLEELYSNAVAAMRDYSGSRQDED